MAFAALAILGHKSAHSFPIGPVIADPVKSTQKTKETLTSKSKINIKFISNHHPKHWQKDVHIWVGPV